MNSNIKSFLFFLCVSTLTSCMDVIDVDLDQGEPQLAVEGWITDQPGPYEVNLSRTTAYFNNAEPPKVSNALVIITDNEGTIDTLIEKSSGKYITQKIQGKIGNRYTLSINTETEKYTATTEIRRKPPIDSLNYVYAEASSISEAGYFVSYSAPELAGKGDYYRFKIYKNGILLNKPSDLIIDDDAFTDGKYQYNQQINFTPFQAGDTILVEYHSLTNDTYEFLNEMRTQVNNGGMFANPPANVRTNVLNLAPNGRKAVGHFGGSGVSSASVIIK